MSRLGLVLSSSIYSHIVMGCYQQSLGSNTTTNFDDVIQVYQMAKDSADFRPPLSLLNLLLSGALDVQHSSFKDILMDLEKFYPWHLTARGLNLTQCLIFKSCASLKELDQVFEDALPNGRLESLIVQRMLMDQSKALSDSGSFFEICLDWKSRLERLGIPIHPVTYQWLLEESSTLGEVNFAQWLIEEMISLGYPIEERLLRFMFSQLSLSNNHQWPQLVIKTVSQLHNQERALCKETMVSAIYALGKSKDASNLKQFSMLLKPTDKYAEFIHRAMILAYGNMGSKSITGPPEFLVYYRSVSDPTPRLTWTLLDASSSLEHFKSVIPYLKPLVDQNHDADRLHRKLTRFVDRIAPGKSNQSRVTNYLSEILKSRSDIATILKNLEFLRK